MCGTWAVSSNRCVGQMARQPHRELAERWWSPAPKSQNSQISNFYSNRHQIIAKQRNCDSIRTCVINDHHIEGRVGQRLASPTFSDTLHG